MTRNLNINKPKLFRGVRCKTVQVNMASNANYNAPSMDWTPTGDIHKRFSFFKQKCKLIFDGPLKDQNQAYKVRMILLWAGDRGLDMLQTISKLTQYSKNFKIILNLFAMKS